MVELHNLCPPHKRAFLCPPEKGAFFVPLTRGKEGVLCSHKLDSPIITLPGPPFLRIFDIREGTGWWLIALP